MDKGVEIMVFCGSVMIVVASVIANFPETFDFVENAPFKAHFMISGILSLIGAFFLIAAGCSLNQTGSKKIVPNIPEQTGGVP